MIKILTGICLILSLNTTIAQTITNQWTFDNASLRDTVSNKHLTAYGATSFGTGQDGKPNSALKFADGSVVRADSAFSFGSTALSISLWVKLDAYNSTFQQEMISSKGGGPGYANNLIFFIGSGSVNKKVRLQVWAQGGANYSVGTTADMPLNQWVHLVGYVDVANQTMGIYMNGVADGTAPFTGTLSTIPFGTVTNYNFGGRVVYAAGTPPVFSAQAGATGQFLGSLDDIRSYTNQVLTETQVKAIYNEKRDTSISTIFDYYWSMDNTAIQGSTTFTTTKNTYLRKGKFGGAYATSRHPQSQITDVSVVQSPNIALTNQGKYSLTGWFNTSIYPKFYPNGQENILVAKREGSNQFLLYLNPDGKAAFRVWGAGTATDLVLSSAPIPLNSWVHLAVTMDYVAPNSTMKLYVNGVEDSTKTFAGLANGNTSNLYFGNQDVVGDYLKQYNGAIDEVRLYNNKVLTPDFILAEASKDLQPDHNWRFNEDVYAVAPTKDFRGLADLTILGNPTYTVGKVGASAICFGSNADYVYTKTGFSLTKNGNYSLSFWLNPKQYDSPIFNKKKTINQIAATLLPTGEVSTTIWGTETGGTEANIVLKSTVIPKDIWTHVVITVDSKTKNALLYINETLQETKPFTFSPNSANDVGEIGSTQAGLYFKGCMDDVRVYKNKAMSLADIQNLYRRTELKETVSTPIRIENYGQTAYQQFDYEPNFVPTTEISFDSKNRPYARLGNAVQTLDANNKWVRFDFTTAIKQAFPTWDGVWLNSPQVEQRLIFDAQDWAYIFINTKDRTTTTPLKSTDLVVYSTDLCRTWQVLNLGTGVTYPTWEIGGVNTPLSNPPCLLGSKGFSALNDDPANELYIHFFKKNGLNLELEKRLLVAPRAGANVAHSGGGKQIISVGDFVHVCYRSTLQAPNGDMGTPQYILTINRKTFTATTPFYLGSIGTAATLAEVDGHNYTSMEMDSRGYIHLVSTGHHDKQVLYRVSSAPNSTAAWSAVQNIIDPTAINGGHTYNSMVIDKEDNLHFTSRYSGIGYTFTVSYMTKPANGTWSNLQQLLYPRRDNYHVWHQKLAVDKKGNLYLNYDYYYDNMSISAFNAFQIALPEANMTATTPATNGQVIVTGFPSHGASLLTLPKGATQWRLSTSPDLISQVITGLKDIGNNTEAQQISLFPNPAQTLLTIISPMEKNYTWRLFNLQGKEMMLGQGATVNIESIPSGMYLLNVNGQVKKFVKM